GKLGSLLGQQPNFALLECDITNQKSIELALKLFEVKWGKPDLIINLAGITSVGLCESMDLKFVYHVNASGLANLHKVFGSRVLGLSTDQIFSGKNWLFRPTEKSRPDPINNYGWSKVGAEVISNMLGGKILRLSRTIHPDDRDLSEIFGRLV